MCLLISRKSVSNVQFSVSIDGDDAYALPNITAPTDEELAVELGDYAPCGCSGSPGRTIYLSAAAADRSGRAARAATAQDDQVSAAILGAHTDSNDGGYLG